MRGSTRPAWCTGGGGSPTRRGRIGSTTRVRQVIEATGVVRGRRRRAVDSTVVDDAVATQDTVTQLIGAVRRVARQVPGAAEVIAAECRGHDYTQPGKPRIDWTDPQARQELVLGAGHRRERGGRRADRRRADEELDETAAAAVALLALVAGQDVEPAEGSDGRDGRWRIARRVAPDRVISTVDEQARACQDVCVSESVSGVDFLRC